MAVDLAIWEPNQHELDIFRKHFAPERTSDTEWTIFIETCKTYRVSPMRKQIYLIGRWDNKKSRTVHTPQISIGGLRALALRTGEFEGTTEPEWGDEEGNWYTLWPKRLGLRPYAARIGVYRRNFRFPKWGVAYFHEMAQTTKEGNLTRFWNDMGIHMVIKCAEADALRGAFEEECGGLYIHEEMNQADLHTPVITITPEVPGNADDALKETASGLKSSHTMPSKQPANKQKQTAPVTDKPTPPVDLSKIPTASTLRKLVTELGLKWSEVLLQAFDEGIKKGKYTLADLEGKGDELPPLYCQHLARYIDGLQKQVA